MKPHHLAVITPRTATAGQPATAVGPATATTTAAQKGPVEPAASPRRGERLAALDGMRFVAAVVVVVFHYTAIWFPWGELPTGVFPADFVRVTSYGWLGVEFFFLISGFVICMSCWGRSLSQFFTSRVIRLYPAYWCAVVMTSVVSYFVTEGSRDPTKWDVLVNLTMLQEPAGAVGVDSVYWTLWVEMRFYLLFALVIWRGTTYRRVLAFCVIWSVLALVATGSGSEELTYVLVPTSAPFFVAGIAFYLMYRNGQNLLVWGVAGFSFAMAQHNVVERHMKVEGDLARQLPTWPTHVLVTVMFALIAALALGWFSRVSFRWLTGLGALTYPLYLVHCEIGWLVTKELRGHMQPRFIVLLLIAWALITAWLIHVVVEKRVAPRMAKSLRRTFANVP